MQRVLLIPTLLLLLLGVIGYLVSAGGNVAGSANPQDRPIVFCNQDDIKTLDIGNMSWMSDLRAAMALWEGLATNDPRTLEPRPGVAESWDISPDGKTYTFHLRRDARWSNGDPVTARDFLFAWKRVLTPVTAAQYLELFYVIQGAQQYADALAAGKPADFSTVGAALGQDADGHPDPYTLVVHLKTPCTYFLDLAAFPPFYPLHEASMARFLVNHDPAQGYDERWTHAGALVSNGPFMLADWRPQQHMVLDPNANYWDRGNVRCRRVILKPIAKDERAAFLALQSGAVDALSFVPQTFGEDLIAAHKAGKLPTLDYHPVFGSYFYIFNCSRKPFDDKRVRKALCLAINRKEIVDNVTRMDQRPLGLLVPPDSVPGYHSPEEIGLDLPQARRLLAEAGFPNGQGFPTAEILYNNDAPIHTQIAQAIGQMWQQNLGISVRYSGVDRAGFSNARQVDHNFEIARAGWYGDYLDPTTFLDLARSTNPNNDGLYKNPDYDKLLDAAAAEPDPAKRFAILRDAERMIIHDECPFIPLYQYGDGYMYDPDKIKGLVFNVRLLTELKWIHRTP